MQPHFHPHSPFCPKNAVKGPLIGSFLFIYLSLLIKVMHEMLENVN